MHSTSTEFQNQTINSNKLGIFSDYFSSLKVGSMLNRSGIVKTKGASPLELFTIVFNLAFIGKNFFEGVKQRRTLTPFSVVFPPLQIKQLEMISIENLY